MGATSKIKAAELVEGAELDSVSDEMTIETQPVKLSKAEEDEYEWIARSTPSASGRQSFIDEWSGSESTPQPLHVSDIEAYEGEEIVPSTMLDDGVIADWSGPELFPAPRVSLNNVEANEYDEAAGREPSLVEESTFAEWSGPELVPAQPVDLKEANESEETATSEPSALLEESAFAEWTGPELMPAQPVDLKGIAPNELEEVATLAVSRLDEDTAVPGLFVDQPGPFVVHSLKNPPEIWDQVPEQPADFHPAVTFLARMTADNRKLASVTLAVMFICGVCTFAVLKLRNAVVAEAQSEHRMEVKPPASDSVNKEGVPAPSVPTVAEPAGKQVTASSEPANDKSSPTSVDSTKAAPSVDSTNQKTATEPVDPRSGVNSDRKKPAEPDAPAKALKNTAGTAKNVVKKNTAATARNVSAVANKRKSAPDTRTVAKSASATPRGATTIGRNAAPTSRSAPTTETRIEAERISQPAPTIIVGDGETRPRRVTPRTSDSKEGASIASPQSRNSKNQSASSKNQP